MNFAQFVVFLQHRNQCTFLFFSTVSDVRFFAVFIFGENKHRFFLQIIRNITNAITFMNNVVLIWNEFALKLCFQSCNRNIVKQILEIQKPKRFTMKMSEDLLNNYSLCHIFPNQSESKVIFFHKFSFINYFQKFHPQALNMNWVREEILELNV